MDFMKDSLSVSIFETRDEAGKKAADDIAETIARVLLKKRECNMIFAAAPSQNEVLLNLRLNNKICWNRVNAFHMDEYIGLKRTDKQCFSNFLCHSLFDWLPFRSVNLINPEADTVNEIVRYSELINDNPPDIVVMGIGENGHIAFNDPGVADFADNQTMKVVSLEPACRLQQVHDKCFDRIEDVPQQALTLTIPCLMRSTYVFCIVPSITKAEAVRKTLCEKVDESCPATILRTHPCSKLYLDQDSASLFLTAS